MPATIPLRMSLATATAAAAAAFQLVLLLSQHPLLMFILCYTISTYSWFPVIVAGSCYCFSIVSTASSNAVSVSSDVATDVSSLSLF